MNYPSFVSDLVALRPRVLDLVTKLEMSFSQGATPLEIPPDESLVPHRMIWQALVQNAYKLRGVKRIMGAPYATHPTQMAVMALKVIGMNDLGIKTALCCVFHDYLEEGDGRCELGVKRFFAEYQGPELAVLSAVILSEPEIIYAALEGERKDLEDVAYIIQLLKAKNHQFFSTLVNASLLDKLDNLHNLEYITQQGRHDPIVKRYKLVKKLACFTFVLQHLGGFADQKLSWLLGEALETVRVENNIPELAIDLAHIQLQECFTVQKFKLDQMIQEYHNAIWPQLNKILI